MQNTKKSEKIWRKSEKILFFSLLVCVALGQCAGRCGGARRLADAAGDFLDFGEIQRVDERVVGFRVR
jgi:hypothetical protein